jgi:hypothetical protein
MVIGPGIQFKSIEGHSLPPNRHLGDIGPHFHVEAVPVHTQVARRVAQPQQAWRYDRHAIGSREADCAERESTSPVRARRESVRRARRPEQPARVSAIASAKGLETTSTVLGMRFEFACVRIARSLELLPGPYNDQAQRVARGDSQARNSLAEVPYDPAHNLFRYRL